MQPLLRLGLALRAEGYAFTTCTPATHARVNARPENAWAASVTGVFGWSRPFRAGVLPDAMLDLLREACLLSPHADGFRANVRFSTLDGVLFAHSAFPTDAADAVFFGPDTYRFADAVVARLRCGADVRRAVDIGVGAGAGALLIARAHPGAAVLAADISDAALEMTRVNAALNGLPVTALRSDVLQGISGAFDLIVSNPPYLRDPLARAYRHGGGALGAALSERILQQSLARLAPGGTLVLYTGAAIVNGADPFLAAVAQQIAGLDVQWSYREVDPDVFGEELDTSAYRHCDRIAAVVLTATKNG